MSRYSKASEYGIHAANLVLVDTYNRYFSTSKQSTLGLVSEGARQSEPVMYAVFAPRSSGTGSHLNLEQFSNQLHREVMPIKLFDECILSYVPVAKVGKVDARTTQEHLENIKNVFSPAVSDLAKIFGVSRQAVYKWISGSAAPESENAFKINRLSEIADKVNGSGIERKDYFLNIKAFNGQSMLDLFTNGFNSIDNAQIDAQVDALLREAELMESSSAKFFAKGSPTNDWLSSESIPGSVE